ncbi:cystatin-B-like [Hoplias malabaricus]|uniref:cystatin-B-like n=1 Tax=Hoplias malabaricus TaxID=27720 RepID=UPI00346212B7
MASKDKASLGDGPWSPWKDADHTVKGICYSLKAVAEEKLGQTFSVFEALAYQSQRSAGNHYRIKVYGGVDFYVQLKVFQETNCTFPSLMDATVGEMPKFTCV